VIEALNQSPMPLIVGVMEGKMKSDRIVAKVGIKAVCEFALSCSVPTGPLRRKSGRPCVKNVPEHLQQDSTLLDHIVGSGRLAPAASVHSLVEG
jgi:hypothetical protein